MVQLRKVTGVKWLNEPIANKEQLNKITMLKQHEQRRSGDEVGQFVINAIRMGNFDNAIVSIAAIFGEVFKSIESVCSYRHFNVSNPSFITRLIRFVSSPAKPSPLYLWHCVRKFLSSLAPFHHSASPSESSEAKAGMNQRSDQGKSN